MSGNEFVLRLDEPEQSTKYENMIETWEKVMKTMHGSACQSTLAYSGINLFCVKLGRALNPVDKIWQVLLWPPVHSLWNLSWIPSMWKSSVINWHLKLSHTGWQGNTCCILELSASSRVWYTTVTDTRKETRLTSPTFIDPFINISQSYLNTTQPGSSWLFALPHPYRPRANCLSGRTTWRLRLLGIARHLMKSL